MDVKLSIANISLHDVYSAERYLDSVGSALHLGLQAPFLLAFLAQPALQLLLLLPHGLDTPLQL